MPQRRKAFRSPSEEYTKILDVVGRYAVHCQHVSFSCKKHGEASMGIAVASGASLLDRIRLIHGSAVAKELIQFELNDSRLGFAASGWSSNANYHVKKTTILLFINHRSVESSALRSAVQRTYNAYLPKGGHPFVYLSIEIDPRRVDVNVHPTKREVNFLNEDEIIEMICNRISSELSRVDASRTFITQSLLPNTRTPTAGTSYAPRPKTTSTTPKPLGPGGKQQPRRADNNLVRTDPKLRKITSMLAPGSKGPNEMQMPRFAYTMVDRQHMQIRLATIKELRAMVRASQHGGLSEMLSTHTFVGVVDTARRIAAIQSGVKLYLVDYGMVCNDYFYQIGLTDFGNFGAISFESPLPIADLVAMAAENDIRAANKGEAPRRVTALLVDKREMLHEYFNMDVTSDGLLKSLPLLAKGYMPSLAKLPRFLLRLGPCVNWHKERECFETFLTELASFYAPEQLPNPPSKPPSEGVAAQTGDAMDCDVLEEDEEIKARRDQMEYMLEHVLFPAFRSRLVATKGLLKGVVEVANLKGLYRVFERC